MGHFFKIGELSKLYHIGVDSLRYYEEIGLIRPRRSESGYRLYSDQDIWKLNVIRDLRELGFSMHSIRTYLDNQSVDSTLKLLKQEQQAIEEKMQVLERLEENVRTRIQTLETALSLVQDQITVCNFPERRCCRISRGYTREEEMDLLIKQLLNKDKNQLYIIGNNQIGSVFSLQQAEKSHVLSYQSVFMIEPTGEDILPAGTYLTVSYCGDYQKSMDWIPRLRQYARQHGLRLDDQVLELLWTDVHTSRISEEHITELQVRINP